MSGDGTANGVVDGKWEYRALRLPACISRRTAATQLAINAELAGWELRRTLLFADGTRKVWLRRKRTPNAPGLIT